MMRNPLRYIDRSEITPDERTAAGDEERRNGQEGAVHQGGLGKEMCAHLDRRRPVWDCPHLG